MRKESVLNEPNTGQRCLENNITHLFSMLSFSSERLHWEQMGFIIVEDNLSNDYTEARSLGFHGYN